MSMSICPASGLVLPRQFIDEKQSLKRLIDDLVDKAVRDSHNIKENYFLVLHMKFEPDGTFTVKPPLVSMKIPPFTSNQMVFWVSQKKGICELLWMVTRGRDRKLKVEFNKNGVAYLQAKGAMPRPT